MEKHFIPTVERGKEKEGQEVLAKVVLHIIRHGEKDGPNDVTQAEDQSMRLTQKGRVQAHERGLSLGTIGGVASGSPRERTGETALHVSHANNPSVTGEENLEELIEKTGHRPWINAKLDMPFDKDHPDFLDINDHYKRGRILRRYTEMDDEVSKNQGDRSQSIYGIQVYNISSLVNRFINIADKLGQRNQRAEELGEEFELVREQNMGTHGSVMESFLVEVVRRTLGEEEKERLLDAIPNGVAVSEGVTINIESLRDGSLVVDFDFSVERGDRKYAYHHTVSPELIEQIQKDFTPQVV